MSSGAAGSDPPITCESSKAPLLSDHAAPEAGLPIMSVHSDSKSKSCARRKMGASCPDHHHQGRRPCQPEHRIYPADRRAAPGLPDKSGVPSRNPVPAGPDAGVHGRYASPIASCATILVGAERCRIIISLWIMKTTGRRPLPGPARGVAIPAQQWRCWPPAHLNAHREPL